MHVSENKYDLGGQAAIQVPLYKINELKHVAQKFGLLTQVAQGAVQAMHLLE